MKGFGLRGITGAAVLAIVAVGCGRPAVGDLGPSPTPTATATGTATPTGTPITSGWVAVYGVSGNTMTMAKADGSARWTLPQTGGAYYTEGTVFRAADANQFFFAPQISSTHGGLYLSTLDGSMQKPLLTDGEVFQVHPVDDTQVVVELRTDATGVDLVKIDVGTGATIPLAVTGSDDVFAAVSGGRVVYHRETGTTSQLRSVKLDGTGDLSLAPATDSETFLGVTSNGRVVANFRPPFSTSTLAQVRSVNADGSGVVDFAGPTVNATACGLVADRVVYAIGSQSTRSIQIANADATGAVPLSSSGHLDGFPGSGCRVTGGGRLLFDRAITGGSELYSVPLTGGGEQDLGVMPISIHTIGGDTIIASDTDDGSGNLFSIDATSGARTTLVTATGTKLGLWTGDGELLARVGSRVYSVALSGGAPALVTPDASGTDEMAYGGLVGGRAYIANTDDAGNGTLYAVDPAAGNATKVVTKVSGVTELMVQGFTPDGRILFGSVTGTDLRIVGADGSSSITLPAGAPALFFPGS